MKITIEVDELEEAEQLIEWLQQRNFIRPDENPVSISVSGYKPTITKQTDNEGWMKLIEETLRDDWEAPENDVWDEFYAKQNA